MRYPCHSCNVRGHWARDNACRPEDVRTNLARLAAMLPSAQLALPQPGGSGTSRSSAILSISLFLVFLYKLQFLTVPFLLPLCTCYRTKNSTHSHKNQSSPRRIQLGFFLRRHRRTCNHTFSWFRFIPRIGIRIRKQNPDPNKNKK
jgi:hypothetical protein